jgi:hypothetical protein
MPPIMLTLAFASECRPAIKARLVMIAEVEPKLNRRALYHVPIMIVLIGCPGARSNFFRLTERQAGLS